MVIIVLPSARGEGARQTDRHKDIAMYRLNEPWGRFSDKFNVARIDGAGGGTKQIYQLIDSERQTARLSKIIYMLHSQILGP